MWNVSEERENYVHSRRNGDKESGLLYMKKKVKPRELNSNQPRRS